MRTSCLDRVWQFFLCAVLLMFVNFHKTLEQCSWGQCARPLVVLFKRGLSSLIKDCYVIKDKTCFYTRINAGCWFFTPTLLIFSDALDDRRITQPRSREFHGEEVLNQNDRRVVRRVKPQAKVQERDCPIKNLNSRRTTSGSILVSGNEFSSVTQRGKVAEFPFHHDCNAESHSNRMTQTLHTFTFPVHCYWEGRVKAITCSTDVSVWPGQTNISLLGL